MGDRVLERPAMLAGWHVHLDLLSSAVVGQPEEWPWSRWEELRDQYEKRPSRADGLFCVQE
jgi:hypothetical protein